MAIKQTDLRTSGLKLKFGAGVLRQTGELFGKYTRQYCHKVERFNVGGYRVTFDKFGLELRAFIDGHLFNKTVDYKRL